MNQLKIKGVTYDIIKKEPVDDAIAAKYPARFNIYLARPKGKVMYYSVEYKSGYVSDPVSLGGMGITR